MNSNTVYGGLGLQEIVDLMKKEQYEFWYVSRRARPLRFRLVPSQNDLHRFCRSLTFHIIGYDELRQEVTVASHYDSAGVFFDSWYKQGHFFANKNNAIKYMNKMVETGRKDIILKAKSYVEKHPECLI
jgi:predicted metallo-beta-lactamase superfamily hydrolase